MRSCDIADCDRRHMARGMCSLHYARWRKHGDPEALAQPWKNSPEDVWRKIGRGVTGFCWLWPGTLNDGGYAQVAFEGRHPLVHRWVYEQLVGPIPEGMHLDHLCRVRHCVNPDHLEPVTGQENTFRGLLSYEIRQNCARGHALTADSVVTRRDGRRRCAICHLEDSRNASARRKKDLPELSRRCRTAEHSGCHGKRKVPGSYMPCGCNCHASSRPALELANPPSEEA